MSWIAFTVLAAFSQACRNALQSHLSQSVSVAGVTFARFLIASPLALLYLLSLYQWQNVATLTPNSKLIMFVIAASIMQIIATSLMVLLFKQNNYAVGAGLAKSEALMAAILGMWLFGSSLSLIGWVGVAIGAVAVLMLSGFSLKLFRPQTALLGVACGSAFALTSLWVREASLATGLPFLHSAAWVLLLVLCTQTLLLGAYITYKEAKTWQTLWHKRRLTCGISVTSFIGSVGWFSAMSLQHVAYVKTLGQIEVFFTLLIAMLWLKQPTKTSDKLGLVLIGIAAVLVMLS
ncbi:DMT family transporter [Pseudoalteromonas byunsanensis]|uniref:Multidrug transporter n=1 Tax=Pseudoalteromonas byunsanensis TaxID=327939 RepID=A0A1S1N9E1_9GAMM|nr:DMT family transporter [Pseudoalteromonas byunsanensis]OHU97987.1 multidrug transporter [Pseudoalteromonas byunsanensis]